MGEVKSLFIYFIIREVSLSDAITVAYKKLGEGKLFELALSQF
mgnify:CR=1 FL=1